MSRLLLALSEDLCVFIRPDAKLPEIALAPLRLREVRELRHSQIGGLTMLFIADPTLVIGLGGTGLKVVTLIKESLLQLNNGVMPAGVALLVIDTEARVQFRADGWGEARGTNRATGPIEIDGAAEYTPITGSIRNHAYALFQEQARAEAHPAIWPDQPNHYQTQWFQADYYFTKGRANIQAMNLHTGAGHLRQFGRMGAFSMLQTVLIPRLRNALSYLRSRGANRVIVQVVGSLVGGTGSAICADVAHLAGQLCAMVGFERFPATIGHFLLTEPFLGTAIPPNNASVRRDFDARAYAALRELTRLQGITPATPYSMAYDPDGIGVLNASLTRPPYDSVYLYEGRGLRYPPSHQIVRDGSASRVADAVMSYLDTESAGSLLSHLVSLKSFYLAHGMPLGQSTYGTIGAYTIELPIYHITESWAHRLAIDALDVLLQPKACDPGTNGPTELHSDRPGGRDQDATSELKSWLDGKLNGRLIGEIVDWGRISGQSEKIKEEKRDEILGYDADTFKDLLAPGSAVWANLVSDAERELASSLQQTKGGDSTYVVHLDQGGNTNAQKAQNLIDAVENMMTTMVGRTLSDRAWMREGGRFHRALKVLSAHHDEGFSRGLVLWLANTLNGSENMSDARARKSGKLGHAIAFLEALLSSLKQANEVVYRAERVAEVVRRREWESLDSEQKALVAELLSRGPGILGTRCRKYVAKTDELVQFHKADIARRVVFELISSLQKTAEGALQQLTDWRRSLGTAPASTGGTYALIQQGMDRVAADHKIAARTDVRWVIADDEPGDQYLPAKHAKYSSGQLDRLLNAMVWKVVLVDDKGPIIDFVLEEDLPDSGGRERRECPFDRRAGELGGTLRGERNAAILLDQCRVTYERAWSDMSVVDYLARNWAGEPRVAQLARRIYDNLELPLATTNAGAPPVRAAYIRAKRSVGEATDDYLPELSLELGLLAGDITANRINARRTLEGQQSRWESLRYGESLVLPSQDSFKLSAIHFGELYKPDDIQAHVDARVAYRMVSDQRELWRTLHVLPAENNALELEVMLSAGDPRYRQRRRELVDEVVRTLEDRHVFALAMLCLAYGEEDYDWSARKARGLLMHQRAQRGNSDALFWRLSLLPEETQRDVRIAHPDGMPAGPIEFQLCRPERSPALLDAITCFAVQRASLSDNSPIDMRKVSETIAKAMKEHAARWCSSEGHRWAMKPDTERGTALRNEAAGLAAHIIRLGGFAREAEEQLAAYPWAWAPGGVAPDSLTNEERLGQQGEADLWTALRIVALRHKDSAQKRFDELAHWIGDVPGDRIPISGVPTRTDSNDALPDPPGLGAGE